MQLEESIEAVRTGEKSIVSFEAFKEKYFSKYKKVNGHIYIHLAEGVCKIPYVNNQVMVSEIALITDDEVDEFKSVIENYKALIELGEYIVKEHKSAFEVIPASITIAEFREQMHHARNDNEQFVFDEIEYYPNQSSFYSPDFEVIDSWIDACFVRLKDGYHCTFTALNKDNIGRIEEQMQESQNREDIKQHELKALKYMFACLKNER